MIQQTNTHRRGFTLIELMLAMTFIAILLLTIAMTVIQMGTIYNRGMAIKEVNQASRDVADDLRRSVQASGVFEINPSGTDTTDFVRFMRPVNGNNVAVSGRLCLGSYSYIWNTIAAIETNFVDRARYLNSAGTAGDTVNFAKVADTGKKYCAKDTNGALLYKNILFADASNTTELLKPGDRTIRVLSFNVTTTASAFDPTSGQRIYQVTYGFGTGTEGSVAEAMVMTNGIPTSCLPPNDPKSNFTYCNAQQFAIVLRAGNTVN